MAHVNSAAVLPAEEETVPSRAGWWGWGLCVLLFVSTTLCYMDRQAMALVGPMIKSEFGIRNEGFGWVLGAFSLAYALCQVPAGYLADRLRLRWTYAGAVVWWSLAGVAAAFAPSLGLLLASRALLGVGESFNWPCALRATSRVLPPSQRGLGNGIFNSGAAIGAVLTPLIVPPLAQRYGWRPTLASLACFGFGWVVLWLAVVRGPRSRSLDLADRRAVHSPLEPAKPRSGLSWLVWALFGAVGLVGVGLVALASWYGPRAVWWGIAAWMIGPLLVALALPLSALEGAEWARSLGEVVRLRRFWVLAAVSISINVCWHFLVNWLPTYLKEDRGLTFLASGMLSALPFLAADLGNLGGGLASWMLARRGLSPTGARMWVMAACALLISSGAWVGLVQSHALALALLGLTALGTAAFMANYFAFCQDVASRHTGFVVGILGGLGNLFVAGFLPEAGKIKDVTGGFGPVFVVVGLLPLVGFAVLLAGWGRGDAVSER